VKQIESESGEGSALHARRSQGFAPGKFIRMHLRISRIEPACRLKYSICEVGMAVPGAGKQIQAALHEWAGVTSGPHRYGGIEYRLGRRELGHVHGDRLVDIPFPKEVRDELVAGGRAEPHHILPDSGWISFYLREAPDVQRAIELLRLSFEIAAEKSAR
jgi:hypothetical protein